MRVRSASTGKISRHAAWPYPLHAASSCAAAVAPFGRWWLDAVSRHERRDAQKVLPRHTTVRGRPPRHRARRAQFSRRTPQRPLHAGRAATLPVSRWNLRGSPPLNMLVRARACTDHPFDRPWPAHPTTRARCLAPYNFEGTWHFDLEWGCDVLWCLFPAGVRCVQRTGVQERAGSRRPAADIALNFAGRCDLAAHHAGAAAGDRI